MEVKKIGIVGAGVMGAGIAQIASFAGSLDVVLCDVAQEFLDKGLITVQKGLTKMVDKGAITKEQMDQTIGRIHFTTNYQDLSSVQLVIEAVTENFEVKKAIIQQLESIVSDQVVIASNTSTFPITQLGAIAKVSSRIVGMHFFNPAPVMQLVEITKGLQTSDQTVAFASKVAEAMGKTVVVAGDSAGFIVNRILLPMINEAIYALSEGVATKEHIDEAMKLGAAHPMGPLALADLIGLDVCLYILETLHADLGDSKYRPCPLLRRYVQAGKLGRKTKEGFFTY